MTPHPRTVAGIAGTRRLGRPLPRLLIALLAGPLLGCRSPSGATRPERRPSPPAPAPARIEPLDGVVGRVVSVQAALRFVVLDFSLSRRPNPGDRLELTRRGTVVGELKTGHHARGNTVDADIMSGNPAPGDEARPVRSSPETIRD